MHLVVGGGAIFHREQSPWPIHVSVCLSLYVCLCLSVCLCMCVCLSLSLCLAHSLSLLEADRISAKPKIPEILPGAALWRHNMGSIEVGIVWRHMHSGGANMTSQQAPRVAPSMHMVLRQWYKNAHNFFIKDQTIFCLEPFSLGSQYRDLPT